MTQQTNQRELKFRVWDNVNYMTTFNFTDLILRKVEFTSDCKIMQFTGIQDKNGKDIYEGDIVKNHDRTWLEEDDTISGEISKIVYTEHGFWVDAESFGYEGENLWNWSQIEIVGNIHENPELLNQ